ncbi:hypothetical protein [Sphingobacterium daejeonense]|uniref:hypothetical protein n=1 Tax=Sphingobacterium daejeonense TaxID=371142 RepID=UPI003D316831
MITQKMSDKEIVAEMRADISDVRDRFLTQVNIRRLVLKADSFPVFSEQKIITSKRRNKWIVIYKADKKSDLKASGFKFILVCTASFPDGVHAFMVTKPYPDFKGDWGLAHFSPHFFARYRLRFHVDKTGMDLKKHFFRKNHSFFCDFQKDTALRIITPGRKMFGTSEQGVALGIIRSEYAISFKTFITSDMLRGDQVEHFPWVESNRHTVTDSFKTMRVLKALWPFKKKNPFKR